MKTLKLTLSAILVLGLTLSVAAQGKKGPAKNTKDAPAKTVTNISSPTNVSHQGNKRDQQARMNSAVPAGPNAKAPKSTNNQYGVAPPARSQSTNNNGYSKAPAPASNATGVYGSFPQQRAGAQPNPKPLPPTPNAPQNNTRQPANSQYQPINIKPRGAADNNIGTAPRQNQNRTYDQVNQPLNGGSTRRSTNSSGGGQYEQMNQPLNGAQRPASTTNRQYDVVPPTGTSNIARPTNPAPGQYDRVPPQNGTQRVPPQAAPDPGDRRAGNKPLPPIPQPTNPKVKQAEKKLSDR
jgi:hypothetical protein